ncbi:zinc ABC transporter permease AztB [Nocardia gamkensis]|uniref:Metal ABC transporter permease n=2 Tax=Nocardia gamkensis TaxID=352869 RepID=A0A7X6R6W7_9NOCA|nr:zinc ABC transporter permease AztB [Nocardia gamkensis]NKY31075.1 metal ABC transporter permease [Nocardia gamkensis]NQE72365.1 Manganese transport system membrane protein MntC [Nocardia gamkensis]
MEWLAPFEVSFVQRALWGGLLVSCLCALAGTWVVLRGMAFLSDAMAHGMLPGVAIAALLGGNLVLGAACSAAAMAVGVSVLGRGTRFAADTGIGLLFVGMLSAGVIIVSRSPSFAVDLTGFLFGDVLAVGARDLWYLVAAAVLAAVISVLGYRAFVALTFDPRKAHTLGLRPRMANIALIGLLTLAIVASFHIVGTLLVFGLLIAPPAAAVYWVHRIPLIMLTAAALGALSTFAGLLISWHASTAAGATIAATAVALFFVSALSSWLRERIRASRTTTKPLALGLVLAVITPLIGCATEQSEPAEPTPHGYVAGAEETDEAQPRLVVADNATGDVRVVDLVTEDAIDLGRMEGVDRMSTDGRFAFLSAGDRMRILDAGAWTVDHGDHVHYYRAPARDLGVGTGGPVSVAHADSAVTALVSEAGSTTLLDRSALGAGSVRERGVIADAAAVPYAEHLLVAVPSRTRVEVRTRDGAHASDLAQPCPHPRGSAVTRRGVVFGCADGALLVTARDAAFTAEKIPYPPGTVDADRAVEFRHRRGSATLVAAAGRRGVWVLDVRRKTWTSVDTGPVVAANTAGEGAALLVLTADGLLHSYDAASGRESAVARPLTAPVADGAPAPLILVDEHRAYLNDPVARAIHEIDYTDNLRTARTFRLDIRPTSMVETGR